MALSLSRERVLQNIDIAIIGAGISGLSLAFWLKQYSPNKVIHLIEKESKVGGWIQTACSDSGQLYEKGPRSIRVIGQRASSISRLIDLLDLTDQVIKADPYSLRRYVTIDNKPVEIPSTFLSFFTNPLGRKLLLSVLREPLRPSASYTSSSFLSLHELLSKRFGSEIVSLLADAMTSGIWASESRYISIKQAFPWLYKLSTENRSVVLGLLQTYIKSWIDKYLCNHKELPYSELGIITFKNGMQTLIKELKSAFLLTERSLITEGGAVEEIAFSASDNMWNITLNRENNFEFLKAKKIIFACQPAQLSKAVQKELHEREFLSPDGNEYSFRGNDGKLEDEDVKISSVVTISLGWREPYLETNGKYSSQCRCSCVKPGFGVLASKKEDEKVLGIVFDSVVFPSQSSSMRTRLSVMIGGTRYDKALFLKDEELIAIAIDRVKKWLCIYEFPQEVFVTRCPQAIPLPNSRCGLHPYVFDRDTHSIYFTSAVISGVAIPDCVDAAEKLAKVLSYC